MRGEDTKLNRYLKSIIDIWPKFTTIYEFLNDFLLYLYIT